MVRCLQPIGRGAVSPYRLPGGPRPHLWVPVYPGSALDVCANGCGTQRLVGWFVRGRNPSRWFWTDPGCGSTEPETGARVYSRRTHNFQPITDVDPKDYAVFDD